MIPSVLVLPLYIKKLAIADYVYSRKMSLASAPLFCGIPKLKKSSQTLAASKYINFTKKLNDKKTYTISSVKKGTKSYRKSFTINKSTGKLTVKKGLKKGTYKVKVKVKALGSSNYKASTEKTVTSKVIVK